eukprot:8184969-Alexandrium_andersonii.AAC.1
MPVCTVQRQADARRRDATRQDLAMLGKGLDRWAWLSLRSEASRVMLGQGDGFAQSLVQVPRALEGCKGAATKGQWRFK